MRAHFLGLLVLGAALTLVNVGCGPSTNATCTVCGDNPCVDIDTDVANCGGCGLTCATGQVCAGGQCTSDAETCDPGDSRQCYSGPSGTDGVGPCTHGTQRCLDNGYWGQCEGEVTPHADVCGNGLDEDCNGAADDEHDLDGDGYTNCGGDCCDSTAEGCTNPAAVNPGAFEAPGNMLDDDCDGQVDNSIAANCDSGLASNSNAALDYAKAMDLCQTATDTDGRWGVISAQFKRADGTSAPDPAQRSIRPDFGGTAVQYGQSMAVFSTGHAAASNQTNPGFAAFELGEDMNSTSNFPADWYAANGNSLPNAPGCPAPIADGANDSVMLELKIRTPTNAKSFSLSTNFFSAEYPEWTCSPYNDFFVVLLDSGWTGSPANPTDKNLAFYVNGSNQIYPVGVNLAYGNTGLFTVCKNGATGCELGSVAGSINTCVSTAELTGTGFDLAGTNCSGNDLVGGATGWLTTSGNVNGGEIITLRIALWDTSDPIYDSLALIDNFQWSIDPSDPGTVIDVD
ncbi:MAG: choice-of-anchor L domain-containing protein [Kofleriaceae bacterium]|nr:choice-of-anchor L domain-containing protein [Myxococcales bacterium]MCB9561554.1 choice-of-anchor L domain-containing protein [Kofleriaceae bacterium]MCB9572271.1 choice-of-anchor L domain-containing protein [Kofleriaceae bacterium]